MKKLNRQSLSLLAASAALLVLLLSSSVFAQVNSITELTTSKHALENLIAGIKSDNLGVKRSSIYFAGKYRIAETENVLIEQLKVEKDPSTRILIALVLYEMGSEEGLLEVKKLSSADNNVRVRRMATQIYNEYLINDAEITASLDK